MIGFAMTTRVACLLALGLASAGDTSGQDFPTRSLVPGRPLGPGNVRQLSYSPDGHLLAVLTTVGFQIRNSDSGSVLNSVLDEAPADRVSSGNLCWSPDGKRIARIVRGIEIWDPLAATAERILPAMTSDKAFLGVAWSPAGTQIAGRSETGVIVWDLASGSRISFPEQPDKEDRVISSFSWDPGGGQIAVVAGVWESEVVDLWDVRRPKLVRRIRVGQKPPSSPRLSGAESVIEVSPDQSKVEWSPDGRILALNSGFGGLSLWNARSGSLLLRTRQKGGVVSLSWSRDSKLLFVGTPHQIRLIRWDAGGSIYDLQSEEWMRCNAASTNGERLAASFDDGTIALWRGRNRQPQTRVQTGALGDFNIAVSGDLRKMASESWQESPGVWDLSSGNKLAGSEAANWGSGRFAWSPDGRTLAVVRQWELQLVYPSATSANRLIKLPGSGLGYTAASWSPDGARILVIGPTPVVVSFATGAVDSGPPGKGVLLWTSTGNLVRRSLPDWGVLQGAPEAHVMQAPDFRYVAVKQIDKLTIWDGQESRLMWTIDFPQNRTLSQVAWSPDSRRLAYVSETGAVDIWDLAYGRVVARWTGPALWAWPGLVHLTWRDKLIALECKGGSVRFWREP